MKKLPYYCPKCKSINNSMIYDTHKIKGNIYGKLCYSCGYSIDGFSSYKLANDEWENQILKSKGGG